METITFTLNQKSVTVPSGTTIMEAADKSGTPIPRLCHHKSLKPSGACRLCIVEEMNSHRVMAACTTPVTQNMAIGTQTRRVVSHRRNIIRLIMAEHPESCLVCGKGNRCELRSVAAGLNVGEINLDRLPNYRKTEAVNSFISRDLSKCILCGRCIRACNELVGAGVLDYTGRGFDARPATLFDRSYIHSTCIFCGTCAALCPTGALIASPGNHISTPETEKLSICGFCSAGCSLIVGIANSTVTGINPAHDPDSINGSTLCVRGHYGHDYLNSKKRLTSPMIRKEGILTPVPWDEAIQYTRSRLDEIHRNFGPDSMGFYGSSKCSCEENYLFRTLSATVFNTNTIDNGSSLRENALFTALGERNGPMPPLLNLAKLNSADILLLFGDGIENSVPMVDFAIKRALASDVKVIHLGYKDKAYASGNAQWHSLIPGSETQLFDAINKVVSQTLPPHHPARDIADAKAFFLRLEALDMDSLTKATGLGPEVFQAIADSLMNKTVCFIMGSDFIAHPNAKSLVHGLLDLSLLNGKAKTPFSDCCFTFLENNSVGARLMGTLPWALPGAALLDGASLEQWKTNWQKPIPKHRGLSIFEMLAKAGKEALKSLYIMGENPARSLEKGHPLVNNLGKIDLIVVQDILDNEVTQLAHVILPGAAPFEKSGSFINLEGRLQFFDACVPPPGDAKPDLEILNAILTGTHNNAPTGSIFKAVAKEMAAFIPFYKNGSGFIDFQQDQIRQPAFSSAPIQEPHETAQSHPGIVTLTQRNHLGCGTRTANSKRLTSLDDSPGFNSASLLNKDMDQSQNKTD